MGLIKEYVEGYEPMVNTKVIMPQQPTYDILQGVINVMLPIAIAAVIFSFFLASAQKEAQIQQAKLKIVLLQAALPKTRTGTAIISCGRVSGKVYIFRSTLDFPITGIDNKGHVSFSDGTVFKPSSCYILSSKD